MKMSLGHMMDDMKTTSEEKVYRMPPLGNNDE